MTLINRALSLALALSPAIAGAQRQLMLAKPDAEFSEPFSIISGVRELKDGRVIVSDSKEKTLQLLDFRAGASKISREGSGPGEWLLPNGIAALPGDSTAIWDGGNRRYLLLGPDAKPVREFRLEPPEGLPRNGYGAFSATTPRGIDEKGNIYFQGSPFIEGPDGMTTADTIPVLRFNRARQRPETVAYVRPQQGAASVKPGPGGRGFNITNGLGNPLVPSDTWAALPDGRVVVLRGDTYRVDIYSDRRAVQGAAVLYEKLPVNAAMKAMLEAERKQMMSGGSTRSRPGGSGGGDAVLQGLIAEQVKALTNMEPWPEYAPAFRQYSAMTRHAGAASQVWVLRTRRSDSDSVHYDVLDISGRLAARVTMAPKSRVIAFGNGTAYVTRTDDDDLQHLQRYRLP